MTHKILIVDDETIIRLNLQAFLEDESYYVVSMASGEAALESLPQYPDLKVAIVDLRLPDMDGSSFIMAAHQLMPNLKFILHTGSVEYVLSQELRDLGMHDTQVLFKPVIDMQILVDLLKQLI